MIVPAMSMFAYSNLGYNIMGLALARIAKQPYTQYVNQHILKPLGMNQSGLGGGSFGGNFVTFETASDGSMSLKWRNYTFKKQRQE